MFKYVWKSCAKTILSDGEVFFSFLNFGDFLGSLLGCESSADGSGELSSQESSAFAGVFVEFSSDV